MLRYRMMIIKGIQTMKMEEMSGAGVVPKSVSNRQTDDP